MESLLYTSGDHLIPLILERWDISKGECLNIMALKTGYGGVYSAIQDESFRIQSLFQVKHRPTSIFKFFRYNIYITGSHFGRRFTNIAKMEGGN